MDKAPEYKVLSLIKAAIENNERAPSACEIRRTCRPLPKSFEPHKLAERGVIVIDMYVLPGTGAPYRVIEFEGGRTKEPPPGSRLVSTTRRIPNPSQAEVQSILAKALRMASHV